MKKMLEIKNLSTIAEDDNDKKILKGLDLEINEGEIHVIMGPNGSKGAYVNSDWNLITTIDEVDFDKLGY